MLQSNEYPLVTVFTLIYNTDPEYIIEALKSVRANNYPNLQHIIIDDCSPDTNPREVVKTWIKENKYECEFYENDTNWGISKSCNRVLSLAKGKYILGVSDDIILPGRIKGDVRMLENSQSTAALVYSICQTCDANSNLLSEFSPALGREFNYSPEQAFSKLLENNFLAASSVTLKTDVVKLVGGFSEEYLFEDYELWLRLACRGYTFIHRPEVTTLYRVHCPSFLNSRGSDVKKQVFLIKLKYSDIYNRTHLNRLKLFIYTQFLQGDSIYRELLEIFKKKAGKSIFYYLSKVNIPRSAKRMAMKIYFKTLFRYVA